jgi:hypothetical protein
VGELGILLSIAGVLVGYARADVSVITVAVILGLASGARQKMRGAAAGKER